MILIEFAPPAPLLSSNDRLHHMKRYQREGLWQEAAWAFALAQIKPADRPQRRSLVHVTLPCKSLKTRRDPHNFFATVKPIVDGLVHAGLWPDDTPEYVKVDEPSFWTASSVLVEISMIGQDV
jgi:crossover junction endodeoxyribonuclease RusA